MKETLFLAILVIIGLIIGIFTSLYYPEYFLYLVQYNYLVLKGNYLALLTSILITNDYFDAGFNFVALVILYQLFRAKAGKLEYLVFFFSGFLGNLLSLFFFSPNTISAGASGGIFGLLSFYLTIDMIEQGKFDFYGFLFLLMVFILSSILPKVDYFAHIGGILGGVILAFTVSYFNKKKGIKYNL